MVTMSDVFNARYNTWDVVSGSVQGVPREDLSRDIQTHLSKCVCPNDWQKCFRTPPHRIGSISMSAEVFRLEFKEGELALAAKLLPVTSETMSSKNEEEISIARAMSGYVERGETDYFPLVYGSALCSHIVLHEDSKFREPAYHFALRSSIAEQSSKSVKRIMAETRTMTSKELERLYVGDLNDVKVPGFVLMSELAYCDLGSLPDSVVLTDENWEDLLTQLWQAIHFMHNVAHLVHGDLHQGNVLILINKFERKFLPLIHDFGKSKWEHQFTESKWVEEAKILDVETILESLRRLDLPKHLLTFLKDVEEQLKHLSMPLTIENVIQYWDEMSDGH